MVRWEQRETREIMDLREPPGSRARMVPMEQKENVDLPVEMVQMVLLVWTDRMVPMDHRVPRETKVLREIKVTREKRALMDYPG